MKRVFLLAALCMALALVLSAPAMAQDDLNCDDFATEADAQAEFDSDPSDPNGLDGDGDGLACEDSGLPAGGAVAEEEPDDDQYGVSGGQYDDEIPATNPNTVSPAADAPLPETGGPIAPAMALPMLALLAAGGIFAFRMVRK